MVLRHTVPNIIKIDELNFKLSKTGQVALHLKGFSNEYITYTKPGYCLLLKATRTQR